MIEAKDNSINVNNNCFDIIRIFCAFTVFLGHFVTHFGVDNELLHNFSYFVRGVPVFFFLSGFFIAGSLEKYSTKEFLKRRVFRVFPELWVCVIINLIIILVSIDRAYKIKDILIYVVTQLTFFQFYTGSWLRGYGVGVPNGALWTITVDIQFYLVSIFLARWLKNCKLKIWAVIIFTACAIDIVLERTQGFYPTVLYKLLQCNIVPFIWIFLIGMFIYYNRDSLIWGIVKLKWIILVLYCLWQYIVPNDIVILFDGIRYNLVTTILLVFLVAGFGFSWNKRLGQDYSYSFYLYHMIVINFIINNICNRFFSIGQLALWLVLSTSTICVLALFSHNYIANNLARKIEIKLKSK